jgi:ABC-2 type transport system permease protein
MTLRLFAHVASVEARKLMSYRADFWINAVAAFVVEITVAWALWTAIFAESGEARIGGFTLPGMVLYYVLALLLGKLVRGEDRQTTIAGNIYDGSLTRYLLFPTGYFPMKYAEHLGSLGPALAQLALFGAGAAFLFDFGTVGRIDAATVGRAALAVALGNLLAFLMAYLLEAVAFWADNVWSLSVMLRFAGNLLGGQLLPLNLFPGWAQAALDLLPFRFLFYFPVMTLVGRVEMAEWLAGMAVGLAWCGILALASRAVWRRGYLAYTGVGI